MTTDLSGINRNNAAEDHGGDFPLIEPGHYVMQITEVKEAQSKARDTQFELTWEFDENHHPHLKGRKVWDTLCLFHSSETPRNIAIRKLRDMENASIGREAKSMEELVHRPMAVKLGIEKGSHGYKDKNRPIEWEPVASRFGNGQAAPPAQAPTPAPAAQQAQANGAGPAWLNNNAQ
ncbi:MAG: DUF669 domain-containing protein [Planctomycetota bacterium]